MTALTPLITYKCNVCCAATTFSCSRCRAAWYCCDDHMGKDWAYHRHVCNPAQPLIPSTLPAPDSQIGSAASFSALILPLDEDRPRIIKVECLAETQSSGPCLWSPITRPHVGGMRQPASIIVTHGVGGAPLRFPLHVFYRTDVSDNEPPVNRSIFRLTSGGRSKHIWRGNVVALKFSGTRRQGYTDITMNDLSSLVAYFLH
ncbi:hypothetical protein BOTBODRAFT_111976 [Botryobasidium botryosum FD-172 SS1]|uniref:MYND-type domain-containing protein n=1 Tax=Botryobasidium botryosum (strain FD-172 SS1) TaxID=930990 RepID=A0A067MBQ4_BOTB1|nr:hypothetical protein BOTBODRAFT_111976 [Botryobasidium botryosum FD-172 SS1]